MAQILTFKAAIPPTGSAIKVGGGAGEAVTLALHCYVGEHINELAQLRGRELMVVIGPVERMGHFAEIIGRIDDDAAERDQMSQ